MLFCFQALSAQPKAETEVMKRMYKDAQERKITIAKSGEIALGAICPGKSMRVVVTDGVLSEMGVTLFHPGLDRKVAPPVYIFIERYLLSLLLKKNQTEQKYLMREDFVELKLNGRDLFQTSRSVSLVLQTIQPGTPFTLIGNDTHFTARWTIDNGNTSFEVRFPKQYDLILGKDKKETAQAFCQDVLNYRFTEHSGKLDSLYFKYIPERKVFEEIVDTYMIPQVRNGKYIRQRGGTFEYVFNERMGVESLLNLFLHADEMDWNNAISLTIKGYYQMNQVVKLPLKNLCAYLKEQKCTGYLGMEEETNKEYKGTVFYINRDLMYKHLLYFKFPKEAFKKGDIVITADFYPYIPINNIGDLYEDITTSQKNILAPNK
ncbi:hypothetical protein D0T60_08410 [Bacteroides sp. 224]|nr:hypothetical protein [Bacteroides sp. 224]